MLPWGHPRASLRAEQPGAGVLTSAPQPLLSQHATLTAPSPQHPGQLQRGDPARSQLGLCPEALSGSRQVVAFSLLPLACVRLDSSLVPVLASLGGAGSQAAAPYFCSRDLSVFSGSFSSLEEGRLSTEKVWKPWSQR